MLTRNRSDIWARPNCAPAYYLGRPASLWLGVASQGRKLAGSDDHHDGRRQPAAYCIAGPRPPVSASVIVDDGTAR